MRWSRGDAGSRKALAAAVLLLGALAAARAALPSLPAAAAQEPPRQVSLYSAQMGFTIPVVQRGARTYVGLVESLDPFGTVSARVDGRRWRLRFNRSEALFTQGSTEARVGNQPVTLAAEFLIEGNRGMVPLDSLPALLSRFLQQRIEYHESAGRLFVGEAAIRFQAELRSAAPPAVVLSFSRAVNPFIAQEPGRLRVVFRSDPVVSPGVRELNFASPLIPSATYVEGNGTAEIIFTGTAPLLATFGDGGRSITITAAPPPPQVAAQPAREAAPAPATPAPSEPAAREPAARPDFFVLVDAGHGGEEAGATLAEGVLEKDLTLSLARRLRQELGHRSLAAALVRDGDRTLSLEERAQMANTARPGLFVSLHAGEPGSGVRVYTALLSPDGAAGGAGLLAWDTAQAPHLAASRMVAQTVAAELGARNLEVMVLAAPVRPLRNVNAPAIAIELGAGAGEVERLGSAVHQQALAAALAEAILAARARLPAGPPRAATGGAAP